jgi:hypothetical protein
VLVLRRDAVALRGAARGAGIAVPDAYSDADAYSHADPHAAVAVYLVVEPASAAGARRFVVFVVRVRVGLVVFVRIPGQLTGVARPC